MTKWRRLLYHPKLPLGPGGKRVTACDEHIALSKNAAKEAPGVGRNGLSNAILPSCQNTSTSAKPIRPFKNLFFMTASNPASQLITMLIKFLGYTVGWLSAVCVIHHALQFSAVIGKNSNFLA